MAGCRQADVSGARRRYRGIRGLAGFQPKRNRERAGNYADARIQECGPWSQVLRQEHQAA